jgi:hypothetical protein
MRSRPGSVTGPLLGPGLALDDGQIPRVPHSVREPTDRGRRASS